jgi:hypothetical protein
MASTYGLIFAVNWSAAGIKALGLSINHPLKGVGKGGKDHRRQVVGKSQYQHYIWTVNWS